MRRLNPLDGAIIGLIALVVVLTMVAAQHLNPIGAFLYGFFVSSVSALLSYRDFKRSQQSVSKNAEESVAIVVKSMISKSVIVIVLLVIGYTSWQNAAVLYGFLFGSFLYFLIQLIRIVKHGK